MPIHGIGVPGVQLLSQVGAMGWTIDDLLCVGVDAAGRNYALALSCKSNVQVTGSGLPDDFVSAAWALWRAVAPFNRESDHIALVTRGRHAGFDALWHDIKSWCANGDLELAIARIDASARHRRVFDSVLVPGTKDGEAPTLADAVALIGRLDVYPVDFQLTPSNSLLHARHRCRMALVSESSAEACDLWEALVQRGEEARLGSGVIQITELLRTLRERFTLKAHPSISAAWSRLLAFTADHRAGIETTLPGGHCLSRPSEHSHLAVALNSQVGCIVVGESGVGKSALVRLVLDKDFADATQIWLGPEVLAGALTEIGRCDIGLDHSLADTLDRSPGNRKILVLDAVERLNASSSIRLDRLLAMLGSCIAAGDRSWRVVLVTQMTGFEDQLQTLATAASWPRVIIPAFTNGAVRSALATVAPLSWIASDDNILPLLANPRTLGWVIAAASSFVERDSGGLASATTIADRLWSRWTGGRAQLQRLMIQLAERDAAFERSFAISELDGADAAAFDTRPNQAPLIVNARHRIEFQHDLASDWARYQRLKEIADDIQRWAVLALQPLWIAALRLLGQHLLTEADQARRGWDHAFVTVTATKQVEAADLLLDALCLDSRLDVHLDGRASLFFSDSGELLLRMLHRFMHVTTVPNIPDIVPIDSGLRIYLEADMRLPIFRRWVPMARFLGRNIEHVAALGASIVAKICALWLSTTSRTVGETAVPFRDVMARLALETARTQQVRSVAHQSFSDRGGAAKEVYGAALAGAGDLPEDVAAFALEMAWRRPLSEISQARVDSLRAAELARQKKTARVRVQRPRSMPATLLSSQVDLPPWPLGPSGRLIGAFRDVVLHKNALTALMQADPTTASEVLLACIIDDHPTMKRGSSMRLDDDLGIQYDQESYPTIFWKSPFFTYLQHQPDAALATLGQLLDFAMERWAASAPVGTHTPSLSISLSDGERRAFRGSYPQFGWSQHSSTSSGQLFSALDALERWLTLKVDAGEDLAPWCQCLLDIGSSTALLGVLVNLGKYQPALFQGPLAPLAEIEVLYWWDDHRVASVNYNFDAFNWSRQGDVVFNIANDWVLARHRRTALRSIIADLVVADAALARRVTSASARWPHSDDPKSLLEQRILRAELDPANRQSTVDKASGETTSQILYPIELQWAVAAYQSQIVFDLEPLTLPYQCEKILAGETNLSEAKAAYLADLLPEVGAPLPEPDEQRRIMMAAAAATLIARGGAWFHARDGAMAKAHHVVCTLIAVTGDSFAKAQKRDSLSPNDALRFAAIGALYAALDAEDPMPWNRPLVTVISGQDMGALSGLMREAACNRERLGPAWYQLMVLLLLAAGLDLLSPCWDGDTAATILRGRWLAQLQLQPVFGSDARLASVDPVGIARRSERLLVMRHARLQPKNMGRMQAGGRKRWFAGLNTHILNAGFAWLLDHERAEVNVPIPENRVLVARLWAFEAWRMVGDSDNAEGDGEDGAGGEYGLLSELGHAILRIAPAVILATPTGEADLFWRPILNLGPDGHYAVNQFAASWFRELFNDPDPDRFMAEWHAMLNSAFDANWCTGRHWHHGRQMLVNLLGLNAPRELTHAVAIRNRLPELLPFYRSWAEKHMAGDENDVAVFGRFLTTEPGRPLRLEGVIWLNIALARTGHFYRGSTGSDVAEAMDVILSQHTAELIAQPASREAMIAVVARLVRDQVGTAMGLQARIGALR